MNVESGRHDHNTSRLKLDMEAVATKDGHVYFVVRGRVSAEVAQMWALAISQLPSDALGDGATAISKTLAGVAAEARGEAP